MHRISELNTRKMTIPPEKERYTKTHTHEGHWDPSSSISECIMLHNLCRSWKYATMIFEGISFPRTNSNPKHKVRFVA